MKIPFIQSPPFILSTNPEVVPSTVPWYNPSFHTLAVSLKASCAFLFTSLKFIASAIKSPKNGIPRTVPSIPDTILSIELAPAFTKLL